VRRRAAGAIDAEVGSSVQERGMLNAECGIGE
jgi:hypothetical protein